MVEYCLGFGLQSYHASQQLPELHELQPSRGFQLWQQIKCSHSKIQPFTDAPFLKLGRIMIPH